MIETTAPQSNKLQRVCIRCGDANVVSVSCCGGCGFDLTSDLQRDYDFYRDGVPIDGPSGVGEKVADDAGEETPRRRSTTQPGTGSSNWRPYRTNEPRNRAASSEPAKATMDLGAAVLEAVFEGTNPAGKSTLDIGSLEPFLLEGTTATIPDPVGWSPSSALHVEPPVVIGEASSKATPEPAPVLEEDEPMPHAVVGAVQDWVDASAPATSPITTRPFMSPAPMTQPPIPAPTTDSVLAEVQVKSEPVSQRNHIKAGATTYLDAVQGTVRRDGLGWWRHQAALPLAIAIGTVTLILFALM